MHFFVSELHICLIQVKSILLNELETSLSLRSVLSTDTNESILHIVMY